MLVFAGKRHNLQGNENMFDNSHASSFCPLQYFQSCLMQDFTVRENSLNLYVYTYQDY